MHSPKKETQKKKKKDKVFKCSLEINYLSMDRFSYLGLVSHLIVNKSCEKMLLQADFGLTLGKKKSFQANQP
jgi:hypothetical protein